MPSGKHQRCRGLDALHTLTLDSRGSEQKVSYETEMFMFEFLYYLKVNLSQLRAQFINGRVD